MATQYQFWLMMGAVLVANLLTVIFVWAFWNIARVDREVGDKFGGRAQLAHTPYLFWIILVSGAVIITVGLSTTLPKGTPGATAALADDATIQQLRQKYGLE